MSARQRCGNSYGAVSYTHLLLHRKISAKRRWESQKAILECKLDGIVEGPKACTVQIGVSHMDEIEHVKNVVYKNPVSYTHLESMDPYTKAKKTCDEKLNADGANAALENIIRIQKDRLSDQKELQALWAKVDKLLK